MTVSNETASITYAGNGATTVFAVPYSFLENSHLKVTLRASGGSESVKMLTTDYTVTGAATEPPTGQVTCVSFTPATGESLQIDLDVPVTQETDYVENDPFPAETHEKALDKLTMIAKQIAALQQKALHVAATDTTAYSALQVPAATARASRFLAFDISGNLTTSSGTGADSGLREDIDTGYTAAVIRVSTVAAMKAITVLAGGTKVCTLGCEDVGDGGHGDYRYDPDSVDTPYGGVVVEPDTLPGRFILLPKQRLSLLLFGVKPDNSTDNAVNMQIAIDYANSLYLGGSFGGGGVTLELPAGKTVHSGVIWKLGVNLVGEGPDISVMLLKGNTSTGIKSAAADSGLAADQVSFGRFEGFSFYSFESAPTTQILWDARGFSRWRTSNVIFEWFGGCTSISVIGSVLASSGGPAQWYNSFYDVFFIHAASRPVGGVACNLGDPSALFEQVTTWMFFGGRFNSAGTGAGLSLRGTGNSFHGVTFEGCDIANDIGSASTRGATSNSFFGCYYEANTTNRKVAANSYAAQWYGTFVTGGVDANSGVATTFDDGGVYQKYAGNSGTEVWEVIQAGLRRPRIRGTIEPGFDLVNNAATDVTIANGAATSTLRSYFRILINNASTILADIGTGFAKFAATNICLNNDNDFGIFSGTGSPEGVVTAKVGSLYLRTNGGASTTLYVKESGTGNTGWVAK